MQKPLTLTFRHIDSSPAVNEVIRKRVDKLEQFYDRIIHCDVMLEAPRHHAPHGFPFEIRIELSVPGKNIVVRSTSRMHHPNVDAYSAIRRAFDATERRLEDYARINRHHVKRHTLEKRGADVDLKPTERG